MVHLKQYVIGELQDYIRGDGSVARWGGNKINYKNINNHKMSYL